MSKKSRKRNKKILAMLALAGGAAMAGRRKRNAAIDTGIASAEADKGSDMLPDSAPVVKTDVAPVDTAPVVRNNEGRTRLSVDGVTPGIHLQNRKKIPGYGTAVAPPSILNPYRAPRGTGPRRFSKGGSVRKAKVTGAAKRGFGRALMKGKK
jgi:hypothetical protein